MEVKMNNVNTKLAWDSLQQVIEPLASYISAADRPKAALMSALALLMSEVKATNRAASAHLAASLKNR